MDTSKAALEFIKNKIGNFQPRIGMVLGSGLDILCKQFTNIISIPYSDIPGFAECSVAGHQGCLLMGNLGEVSVACLKGRAHYYEGRSNSDIQTPIRTLKLLGCEALILTNAAASLRKEVTPGNLVVITDHINFQFQNPLVGPNNDLFGPRFPSLQDAYDDQLVSLALKEASKLNIDLATGVYLATLGPSYETPAEIRAFKLLGADMVGMSTVAEVILGRHCNMKILAISSITNMACGMSDEFLTHEKVLEVAQHAAGNLSKLLFKVVNKIA